MVTYKSNQYSVPAGYIGKTVGLQVYDNTIYIYSNTDLIAQHHLSHKKINYQKEHYIESLTNRLPYKYYDDIEELALRNLQTINEVYDNE